MRNVLFVQLVVAGFISVFATYIHAEPVELLETVVVSATRSEQDSIVTPSSIMIITDTDIQASGASHIIDILRNQGGIQISDLFGDGSRATISMRGFGGNAQANALILVDGRRLNNSDLGIPDLNSVSLKDIERIEIIRGSAGVLYGDQAVGGVINIITRRPEALHAGVDVNYGSYDNRSADLEVSNRHENGLGYRFTGEKKKSDNYRDNNELSYTNLFGLMDFRHETGTVFLEYQDIDEDLETPGALFIDMIKADRQQPLNPDDFINTDTRDFRIGFTQSLWYGWDLHAEYTNRMATSDGLLSFAGVPGPFLTKRDHRELTPRLIGKIDTGNGPVLLTFGADIFSTEFFLNSILGAIDNDQSQYSFYGQGVVPLTGKISLTLGARHGDVENDIIGALLPQGTEINDDVNAFEAGLSYRVDENWRLFGRVDTNYRYVLADEFTSASFGGVIPDTQTGRSYEFGFDWLHTNANVNFVFYRLNLKDEIDFDPVLFINTNIGDTRRNGFIVDANYSPIKQLLLGFSWSYVNAEIENGALAGLDIPFVAKHTVRLTSGYQFSDRLRGQAEILGITERIATGDFFNANASLPGYVISNIYLSYRYDPVTIGFRINNLLDKEYNDNAQAALRPPLFTPETAYYPAPERNFMFTFLYEFN